MSSPVEHRLIYKWDALRDLVPFVQFQNVKNTRGGVLLLVKLQTKSKTPPSVFFTFFKS